MRELYLDNTISVISCKRLIDTTPVTYNIKGKHYNNDITCNKKEKLNINNISSLKQKSNTKSKVRIYFMILICFTCILIATIFNLPNIIDNKASSEINANTIIHKDKYYTTIKVTSGDSTWKIAKKYFEQSNSSDIREYVYELCELNNILYNDPIYAGQNFVVYYYK